MHKALNRFECMARKASRNHSKTCWGLKCDIRKFFASVDHFALVKLLEERITDKQLLGLLCEIIGSFSVFPCKGIPLGNLTSQLFANIYMHSFDQFVKHRLRASHYIRYADDFVLLSPDRNKLKHRLAQMQDFLSEELDLEIHPDKVFIKTFASGVDFLGWVHFPRHRVLRTKTEKRMMKRMVEKPGEAVLQSYLGLLENGSGHRLQQGIQHNHWLFTPNERF